MCRFLILKERREDVIEFGAQAMMSWSICSGCQTAADLPSVFTFFLPHSTYAGWLSLWARSKLPLPTAHPHPPLTPYSLPSPLNEPALPLRCFSHALRAAAGPQRHAWYTLCRETKNPMQLKSEWALGCKDSPGWHALFYCEWGTPALLKLEKLAETERLH